MMSKIFRIVSLVSVFALALVSVASAATLVAINDNPAIGNELRLSGECDTGLAGEGVQIRLIQGSNNVLIGNLVTEEDGVFSGTLTIPELFVVGNATLQATCTVGGDVATFAVTLTPDNDVPVPTPTPAPTGGAADDAGDVGGAAVSEVPTGGVAAGVGSNANLAWLLTAILVLAGAYAYATAPKASLNI